MNKSAYEIDHCNVIITRLFLNEKYYKYDNDNLSLGFDNGRFALFMTRTFVFKNIIMKEILSSYMHVQSLSSKMNSRPDVATP